MKSYKNILLILGVLFMSGCGKFGDINIDPNKPSAADASMFFTRACTYAYRFAFNSTYDPFTQLYPQYLEERVNVQYSGYRMRPYDLGAFYVYMLGNLETIIRLNTDETTKNQTFVLGLCPSNANQIAVAQTLRAFAYMHMTDVLGMVPYSEANRAGEDIFSPKYDTQESIYTDLDNRLNEAYAMLDPSKPLKGMADILFRGDINKWKKLNASIRMMMAIKLSDVDPGTGKTRFAKAYADGGIHSNADRLTYKFLAETANENLLYNNIVVSGREDFSPSATIIDTLVKYNDPRLEVYAAPNVLGEYVGVPYGRKDDTGLFDRWSEADQAHGWALFSRFHPKYYQQDSPLDIITPSHIISLEAEAAVRGWIAADPAALYKEMILKSFTQHGISETKVDAYLAQPSVAFGGSENNKIRLIAIQRWLANFMQDGIEVWSSWRRLNYPVLHVGLNAGSVTHIPYRRTYSADDYNANKANYEAAVASQGADNFDTRVWWDVADNK